MGVYDDQKTISDDELRAATGINKEQEGAHDREAQRGAARDILDREHEAAVGGGWFNPGQKGKGGKGVGSAVAGATPEGKVANLAKQVVNQAYQSLWGNKKNRKKTLLGGGAGVGAATFAAFIFFGLSQQALIQLMSGVDNHIFASVNHTTTEFAEKKLTLYIANRIVPRLGANCKTSADLAKCVPKDEAAKDTAAANDPDKALLDAWDEQGMYRQLADQGVVVEKKGGRVIATLTDKTGKTFTVDITKGLASGNLFTEKSFVAAAGGKALDAAQIAVDKILAPFKAAIQNRAAEILASHGYLQFCVLRCKPTADPAKDLPEKTQAEFAEVVNKQVYDGAAGSTQEAISCLVEPNCNPAERPKAEAGGDLNSPEARNDYQKATDQAAAEATNDDRSKVSNGDKDGIDKLEKDAVDAEADKTDKSFMKFIAKFMSGGATSTFGDVFVKSITKYLKIAGAWQVAVIQIAAKAIKFISNASTYGKAINYTVRAAPYLIMFSQYAAAAAEQKTGSHVSQRAVGSLNENLAGGSKTPAYPQELDPNNARTSAADTHKILKEGGFVLNDATGPLITASETANKFGLKKLVPLASFVDTVITKGTAPLTKLIELIPGLNSIINAALFWVPGLLEYLISAGFHLPNFTHLAADGKMNMLLGGGELAAKQTATAFGGHEVTPEQAKALGDAQLKRNMKQFHNMPLFARLFSFNTPYSLASRMAVALPINFGVTPGTMTQNLSLNIVTSPISKMFGSFSTIFQSSFVHAAQPASASIFGVTPSAVLDNEIDPAFWSNHSDYCNQQEQAGWPDWVGSMKQNKETAQWEYTKVNQCLMNKQLDCAFFEPVGINGERPTSIANNPCPQPTGASAASSTAGIKPVTCAQSGDKPDSGSALDKYSCNSNVGCFDPSTSPEAKTITTDPKALEPTTLRPDLGGIPNPKAAVRDLGFYTGYYNGKPHKIRLCAITGFKQRNNGLSAFGVKNTKGDIAVNSRVSGAIWALFWSAKSDKSNGLTFSSFSSFRTMAYQKSLCPCDGARVARPGYSNHQMGLAIDYAEATSCGTKGWNWLHNNASRFGILPYSAECWHWSTNGH